MQQLKAVKRAMRHNLWEAIRGWWIWHRVVKRYHLGRTMVVLLPGCNKEYNYAALRYADQMLAYTGYGDVIFLSVDPVVKEAAPILCRHVRTVEVISRLKAQRLMQYYCLFEFDQRFLVASLEEPNGRNAKGLVGVNGTTVEELIALGVYRLPEFQKEPAPECDGANADVKELLQAGGIV